VKLHPLLGDPNSDYINANYIDVSEDGASRRGGVWAGTGASRGLAGSAQQRMEELRWPKMG